MVLQQRRRIDHQLHALVLEGRQPGRVHGMGDEGLAGQFLQAQAIERRTGATSTVAWQAARRNTCRAHWAINGPLTHRRGTQSAT